MVLNCSCPYYLVCSFDSLVICLNVLHSYVQPQVFRKMRADLASLWSTSSRAGNPRRISARASLLPLDEKNIASEDKGSMAIDEDITSMKVRVKSMRFKIKIMFLLYVYYIPRNSIWDNRLTQRPFLCLFLTFFLTFLNFRL